MPRDPRLQAVFGDGPLSDIDFEAEVARRMGPFGQKAIDVNRTTFYPDPAKDEGLYGFYTHGPTERQSLLEDGESTIFSRGTGETSVPNDMVHLVGGERGGDPRTAPHEFRHRAMGSKVNMSEEVNRLWDLWRSDTPEDWARAARFLYPNDTPEDADRKSRDLIERTRDTLITAERKSMQNKGMTAPRRGALQRILHPHTSDETAFLRDQAEIREKRRDFDGPNGPSAWEMLTDPEFWARDVGGHARRVLLDPLKVAVARFEAISDPRAPKADRRAAIKEVFDQLGPAGITKAGKGLLRTVKDPEVGVRFWELPILNHNDKMVGDISGTIHPNPLTSRGIPGYRDEIMQVSVSHLDKAEHGKGVGMAAYEAAAREAEMAGMDFASDTITSAQAQRMYEGLERRGWTVWRNPTSTFLQDPSPTYYTGTAREASQETFERVTAKKPELAEDFYWESGNGLPNFIVTRKPK